MNIKYVIIFSFSIMMLGCVSPTGDVSRIEISQVVVLDSDFNKVKVIDQPEQLHEISKLWQHFKRIDKLPNTNWTYKLDIQSDTLSGRWLYNKQGYLAKLNYQLTPMYQVEDTVAFNEALGFLEQ